MRKWIPVLIALVLLWVFFFHFHAFFKKRVLTVEFKQQTERRLSEILKARVKIGKIHLGLLKHLSLSGLQIDQGESQLPVQIGVRRIVIRYDLFNFIQKRFKIPAEVLLEMPVITIPSFASPFFLPVSLGSGTQLANFRRIELQDGKIGLTHPVFLGAFAIEKIKGRASFDLDGALHMNFKGELEGAAKGFVSLEGSFKPGSRYYALEFEIKDGSFLSPSVIPVTDLNGKIHISGSDMIFDRLQMKLRDLPVEISGKVEDVFSPYPRWHLSVRLFYSGKPLRLDMRGDQKSQEISGTLTAFGRSVEFTGSMTADARGIHLHRLLLGNGYVAYGIFRFSDGHYVMNAEKGKQRFSFNVDIGDLGIESVFNINHLSVYGYDITTFARLNFSPVGEGWERGNRRFSGFLRTDYFVLNFQPLHDLKANFEVSELGINPLLVQWGNRSQLSGSVTFAGEPAVDGYFSLKDLRLSEMKFLGSHPMPVLFEGILEGKIKIAGPIQKPDLSGQFLVRDGKIGEFKYDEAVIEFYGQLPYFRLLDSKITRKDNTFLVKGDIDFQLENIFQKVKIISLDQIVIWKGLDVSSEIETKAKSEPLEARKSDILRPLNVESSGPGTRKLEAEYEVAQGKSLKVTAEEEESGKQIVTVGPKLRF